MKTKDDFIRLVQALIGENKIEETFNLIENYADKNTELLNTLSLLRSRTKNNNNSYFSFNVIKREEYALEFNRINFAILGLIKVGAIDKEPEFPIHIFKLYRFVWGLLLMAMVFIISIYFNENLFVSSVLMLFFILFAYLLRNVTPCLWRFIYSIVDIIYE